MVPDTKGIMTLSSRTSSSIFISNNSKVIALKLPKKARIGSTKNDAKSNENKKESKTPKRDFNFFIFNLGLGNVVEKT